MGIQTSSTTNLWVQYVQQLTRQTMRTAARTLALPSCTYSQQQMEAWQQPSALVRNLKAANHSHLDYLA